MSQALEKALNGQPWSVSELIFDLADVFDDEGRPIAERRARASVRAGVAMDMKECPYSDLRQGKLMNTSALVQVSRHYNTVMADLAGYRAQAGGRDANWTDILAAVLDQLARPAIHLLTSRDPHSPVPARDAVSHKLGAGFFGVMQTLHERLALGVEIPVTTAAFLSLIAETQALVGAGEVCAGSPPMIRNACTALIEGSPEHAAALPGQRLIIGYRLALQVELGIFWRLYDRHHYRQLLAGPDSACLQPFNKFLTDLAGTEAATAALAGMNLPVGDRLPVALSPACRTRLGAALTGDADPELWQPDFDTVLRLLEEPGSVVGYTGDKVQFAKQAARYAHAFRSFRQEISAQEAELRAVLGYDPDTPVHLGPLAFMPPKALPWFERVVGIRLGDSGRFDGSRVGVRQCRQDEVVK